MQRHGHGFNSSELADVKASAVEKLHEFHLGRRNKSDEILDGGNGASRRRRHAEVEEIRRYLLHIRRLLCQVSEYNESVKELALHGKESGCWRPGARKRT